jgi:hypothetical protein
MGSHASHLFDNSFGYAVGENDSLFNALPTKPLTPNVGEAAQRICAAFLTGALLFIEFRFHK